MNALMRENVQNYSIAMIEENDELTMQKAAELLNVSRPYFINLLNDGKIPYHTVGTKRRVLVINVLRYKTDIDNARLRTLDKLSAFAQKLNLGY